MDRTLSPVELLDPRYEVVPFHGRVDELAELARWREGDEARSVLLLHGPAGVGKTRLARHFAADSGVSVVDDADLATHLDLREPRVLLISRTAGWWWSAHRQRAADLGYRAADLAVTARPDEHETSFATACAHFAYALGLPIPTTTPPDAPTLHDLHLAALVAVHGSPVEPAPTRGRLAEDALAVTLLDERITPDRTPEALELLLRAAERLPHARRRAEELFTAHPELADTATGATLRILAEWPAPARAVARRVFDDPRFHGDPLPAILTRTLAREAGTRLEQAELHGLLAARAALASLREEAVEAACQEVALYREAAAEDPAEHRPALADALADLSLRHIAAGRLEDALTAAEEAAALCRVVAAEDRDCAPQLARALDQLGRRRAALGRRAEALAALDEAADLYRDLAEAHPKLFRVDLAKVTDQRIGLARGDQ
ncbi:ATP-binding protein [Saccharothrix sp. 6-C]|uniref:ATP-binding protein n=1 Tax=Saccharothrix sp. 6-C TaxID=2781735 RepID=UPI001916D68B|nr:ATP-binding protein [Saccharothrix sp. 6-C]QQQ77573.1 ATP-binding protein [Saccharothrix sp. 6-C]